MRCSNCEKFVSYGEPEAELGSFEIQESSVVVNATVKLNCAECGGDLKQAEFETTTEFDHECLTPENGGKVDDNYTEDGDQYTADDPDLTGTSRQQATDKKGKPIPFRYRKTFYGFETVAFIHCCKCGQNFDVTISDELQASFFDEV